MAEVEQIVDPVGVDADRPVGGYRVGAAAVSAGSVCRMVVHLSLSLAEGVGLKDQQKHRQSPISGKSTPAGV